MAGDRPPCKQKICITGMRVCARDTHLILDESSEREEIEEIGKIFPYISIAIFAQAFIVEAVDLCNLT